jgi:hypothetical protein
LLVENVLNRPFMAGFTSFKSNPAASRRRTSAETLISPLASVGFYPISMRATVERDIR